jgi:hypothetical protein
MNRLTYTERKKVRVPYKLKKSKRDVNMQKYEDLNSEINLLVRTINLNCEFNDLNKKKLESLEKVKIFLYN